MPINNYHNLLAKLVSIQDKNVLKKIENLIVTTDKGNPVFKVTDNQREMLMKSEEDIRKGNIITDDELNAEEDTWFFQIQSL